MDGQEVLKKSINKYPEFYKRIEAQIVETNK